MVHAGAFSLTNDFFLFILDGADPMFGDTSFL